MVCCHLCWDYQLWGGVTCLGQWWSTPCTPGLHWAEKVCWRRPCSWLALWTGRRRFPSGSQPEPNKHRKLWDRLWRERRRNQAYLDTWAYLIGGCGQSLVVHFMPFSKNSSFDGSVVHKIASNISTSIISGRGPTQHHVVLQGLLQGDSGGLSWYGCEGKKSSYCMNCMEALVIHAVETYLLCWARRQHFDTQTSKARPDSQTAMLFRNTMVQPSVWSCIYASPRGYAAAKHHHVYANTHI